MKIIFLSIFLLLSLIPFSQQSYTGIVSDNFVSSNVSSYNPSSIVDSKSKLAISFNFNNSKISNFWSNTFSPYGDKSKYIDTKNLGYIKSYLTIDLINFKYELNHENAFAYSYRIKSFSSLRGVPTVWAENMVNTFQKNITDKQQDINGMSITNLSFTEHAFTYARTLFNRKTSLLKAGATVKILNGIDAKYFYANGGNITFNATQPDMQFNNLDADFGKSYGSNSQLYYKNRGAGLDLGFTYEIRPDPSIELYDMDGVEKNVRYDINKYTLKFTGSITDLGWIRFMKDTTYYNFSSNSAGISASTIYNVDALLSTAYPNIKNNLMFNGLKSDKQQSKFLLNLPTSIHLSADYNILKNMYVSYNFSLPLIVNSSDKTKIPNFFIHSITPRIEKNNYSIMMPISQMGNGKAYLGLAGRFAYKMYSVFLGSNNLAILYGQKSSLARNFFFGISYSILYKVPSDRDLDKVSDLIDQCPVDPGKFEFLGCPDTDGDKIIDKEDNCIYNKGTRQTNGCPDTDGDGLIDMNDMCPTIAGLPIHYGCPDRDFDGVIDAADKCPDIPGIELNNGCPFENQGCCTDNDGDGITNKVDKCPEISGSVYNFGCPIDSASIHSIHLKEEKDKKDANNTNQQIDLGKKTLDARKDLITSKEEYDKLLVKKEVVTEHTVHFDIDQSTLSPAEQKLFEKYVKTLPIDGKLTLMVIGYTDQDGSLDYNLTLSKKRAETIKRKLIDAGFPEKNITVYYYGESKLIHKGDYSKEIKAQDRKVEIKLIKSR